MQSSHDKLMAVLDCIGKQQEKTKDYIGTPCMFGVGLPSAIASVRSQMTTELLEAISTAGETDEDRK